MGNQGVLLMNIRSLLSLPRPQSADFGAGLVVFLISLPLCLGIALASGAPSMIAGLVAGVIGGIVVGAFSGSNLSVTGPAAGLTAVVLEGIHSSGGYANFLLAIVLAGMFQILMGLARAGTFSNYFPSSVIKGMLAAIGITLILKNIQHAVGFDKDFLGDVDNVQGDVNTFSMFYDAIEAVSPMATLIFIVSLGILMFWDRIPLTGIRKVPAPLVVVVLGILIHAFSKQFLPQLALSDEHLVQVPHLFSGDGTAIFTFPDFSAITNSTVWGLAITIALVASVESLLCIDAVDKIDPDRFTTPRNRELVAQGAGNMLSGLLGGLPVTSVIVRSAANLDAGARTKWSAIVHGVLLLLCVLAIPGILNLIPFAALAALLMITGLKLNKISLYKEMYTLGFGQLLPFLATIIGILTTNLLKGIGIGIVVAVIVILRRNIRYQFVWNKGADDNAIVFKLPEEVNFLQKAAIRSGLNSISDGSIVLVDGTHSVHIDQDVLEMFKEFEQSAKHRNIQVTFKGIQLPTSLNIH